MPKIPFIVIESLDGAGGSTQLALLENRLKRQKKSPQTIHFPQEGRATGKIIYSKYLQAKDKWSRREQALLYIQDFFSQKESMEEVVSGKTKYKALIADRYCTSTMAYQTIGLSGKKRSATLTWIRGLCWQGSPQLLKPDLVILLDIPPQIALRRIKQKRKDRHEKLETMQAVRRSYMRLAIEQKWTVVSSIDESGERSRDDIHEEIWKNVQATIH